MQYERVKDAALYGGGVQNKAAVRHPVMGWGRRPYGYAVGIAPSADGALGRLGISRRARRGCFAGCGQREFRPLRRATGDAVPWTPAIF